MSDACKETEILEIPPKVWEEYDKYRRVHIEGVIADARAQIEALNLDVTPEMELAVIEQVEDWIRAESDFLAAHGRWSHDTLN